MLPAPPKNNKQILENKFQRIKSGGGGQLNVICLFTFVIFFALPFIKCSEREYILVHCVPLCGLPMKWITL